MTPYSEFIHKSRYARWNPEAGRRETWPETVTRYFDFLEAYLLAEFNFKMKDRPELEAAVVAMEIMPSMRCMMTAGPALVRNHIAAYNCAFLAVDSPRAFDETLYILLHGTGVGFSVEREAVAQLPRVAEHFERSETTIVVADSKEGWHAAYKELINLLYAGQVPRWDTSKVRPAGARLNTFGGRASGPGPLEALFRFTCETFENAQGRRLTTLECHDLMCKIAEAVVVGGVRRSALISLSNLQDDRIRNAKTGQWYDYEPQRALANNSVVYTSKPDSGVFMEEWLSLYKSKSGERGIFNRAAADRQAAKSGRREPYDSFGTNPCSEIILRSKQFCNLTEVIVRSTDNLVDLTRKVKLATILGTYQSTLTKIKGLSKKWTDNTEEERLLGVSLSGIYDNTLTAGVDSEHSQHGLLAELKDEAITTNKKLAQKLGINQAAAITCVKPSGTVSQLVDCASGIHPRHSPYYIRTVRGSRDDPLTQFLIDQGVPYEACVNQPDTTVVLSFPQKSPDGAICREDVSAWDHLEMWRVYQDRYCEHKPSITVNVKEDEWMSTGAYVYEHFDDMSGVSFLPHSEHTYRQAPYQEITKEEYEQLEAAMPTINWEEFDAYEQEDNTDGSQELACTAGVCEVVNIGVVAGE